ncbi:HNH endonuclease [Rhizobium leguminosarum]|uniref:HNH endonuclease n=1 Tax=Rhizobium leguminosarum TaxID=384 RepID=UPI001030849A|nr:HNH endonuclease [Rhizobium leguminosarum]TBH22199.1 HNH endonuclease [Rhizobium leguminosarum]
MATFLLKLHSAHNLGGAEPRPQKADEWEGIRLNFKNPSKISVSDGDILIVWTHEADDFGRGYGLTAEGIAQNVSAGETHTQATLADVKILSPHYSLKGRTKDNPSGSRVIDRLRDYILENTYLLEDMELSEFREVVDKFRTKAAKTINESSPLSAVDDALVKDKQAILDGLERRFSCREARPEQAAFRAALMMRYGGRCAISGCRIEPVLQAAHILPFSDHIEFRNDTTNGLLLRADVHTLFDRALISINPQSYKVVLSPKLQASPYSSFSEIQVPKVAQEKFLRTHFNFFRKHI